MKFTDLNPKREIGAHSLLIELGSFRLLIDGGVSPKDLGRASLPDYSRLAPNSIDLILLTHCHLDHIGSLPCIHRTQPRARLLMTPASSEILPVMLHNSYSVMLRQREEQNVEDYPLFTREEVDAVSDDTFIMHFGRSREFVKGNDRIRITLFPAGHVMGAASVQIDYEGKSILFTGDILFRRQHTLNGAQIPAMKVDTLVMETTRGCTEHRADFTYEAEVDRLINSVGETLKNGGSCLLPVFALGRMQEMLTLIHEAKKRRLLPKKFPIYCSGLGLAVVDVFENIYSKRQQYGLDFRLKTGVELPSLTQDVKHRLAPTQRYSFRKQILRELGVRPLYKGRFKFGRDVKEPSVFVMSSGMLMENTPAYQIASCLLGFAHNLIAFTGYCDPDTPGGKLQQKQPGEIFRFDAFNYETPIQAQIQRFDLSGHADREHLLSLAVALRPKTVILSHGEMEAREWFSQAIDAALPGTHILNPEPQESYEI